MKLFHTGNSPYARRARIAARLAVSTSGLNVEEIDVAPLMAEDNIIRQFGPGFKVPGLATDSGAFFCETLVITSYLNEQSGGKLMPGDQATAEQARELEGIASLLLDSLFARSHEKRREPGEHSPAVIEKEAARATRSYDALDARLFGQPASLNLGTIAAIAALGYADWRHADDNWRTGRDGLAAWFDDMMKHEAVADTKPVF